MISQAASDVLREMLNQDQKWGQVDQRPSIWLTAILNKANHAKSLAQVADAGFGDWSEYRAWLVKTAATTLAAIECFDRSLEKNSEASQP